MITIHSKFDLNKLHPSNEFVYIQTIKKVFRYDGEWIEKSYFTVHEICSILDIHPLDVYFLIKKLKIDARKEGRNVYRINISQLQKMMDYNLKRKADKYKT